MKNILKLLGLALAVFLTATLVISCNDAPKNNPQGGGGAACPTCGGGPAACPTLLGGLPCDCGGAVCVMTGGGGATPCSGACSKADKATCGAACGTTCGTCGVSGCTSSLSSDCTQGCGQDKNSICATYGAGKCQAQCSPNGCGVGTCSTAVIPTPTPCAPCSRADKATCNSTCGSLCGSCGMAQAGCTTGNVVTPTACSNGCGRQDKTTCGSLCGSSCSPSCGAAGCSQPSSGPCSSGCFEMLANCNYECKTLCGGGACNHGTCTSQAIASCPQNNCNNAEIGPCDTYLNPITQQGCQCGCRSNLVGACPQPLGQGGCGRPDIAQCNGCVCGCKGSISLGGYTYPNGIVGQLSDWQFNTGAMGGNINQSIQQSGEKMNITLQFKSQWGLSEFACDSPNGTAGVAAQCDGLYFEINNPLSNAYPNLEGNGQNGRGMNFMIIMRKNNEGRRWRPVNESGQHQDWFIQFNPSSADVAVCVPFAGAVAQDGSYSQPTIKQWLATETFDGGNNSLRIYLSPLASGTKRDVNVTWSLTKIGFYKGTPSNITEKVIIWKF